MKIGISTLATGFCLIAFGCGDKGGGDSDSSVSNGDSTGEGTGGDESGSGNSDSGTADTSGSDGEATDFVPITDMPGAIDQCDPLPEDDCDDGEKCTYDNVNGMDVNICVPIMGDGEVGDECMSIENSDTCGNHKLCWGIDPDTMIGVCIEFCGPGMTCPENAPCTVTNDGTLPLCLPPCDPLAPDCPMGWACYDDPSGMWFCDRDFSAELGAHGDPCMYINGCDPGLICVAAEAVDDPDCAMASGCCTVVCDISDPIVCPGAAEECVSYYADGMAPPQFTNVGVCVIPA